MSGRRVGSFAQNAPDGGQKSHIQHAVGFIKDQHLDAAQVGQASINEILQAPGSCDDRLLATAETLDLGFLRHAANDQRGSLHVPGAQLFVLLVDLHRASSRVGNKNQGLRRAGRLRCSISINGITKASVLPVPVCAVPITSLPSRAGGMALSWIGVKVVKFAVASLCCNGRSQA